jgi:hypothetical protein
MKQINDSLKGFLFHYLAVFPGFERAGPNPLFKAYSGRICPDTH